MQPLSKYRVVSFGQAWAAPYGDMMLADMGADVIKVEPPGIGDHVRKWTRSDLKGLSPHLMAVNRNKRGIVIDLTKAEGRELAIRLMESADAVIENFSPGTMKKLGVDYDSVKERCPRLVYCSVSGFGNSGPYAKRPAYDMIIQGEGGFISVTGTEDGQHAKLGAPVLDVMTAMIAAYSIVCALLERDNTGKGRYLDIAMIEAAASAQGFNLISYSFTGEMPKPLGTAHPLLAPYQVYSTQSIPISIGILTDLHWGLFCRHVIDRPDLVEDPRFVTAMARIDHRIELNEILIPLFLTQKADYWLERLDAHELVCGGVNDMDSLLHHPQLAARNFFYKWPTPVGDIAVPGMPWRQDSRDQPVKRMPPGLGEHSEEILGDWLSLPADEIARLKAAGVIVNTVNANDPA